MTPEQFAEIECRHEAEPKEQMQSYLSAVACYRDRAAIIAALKARMPTREQIAAATYRAFGVPHPNQNPPYTADDLRIADAILKLLEGTP